jgi:ribosome-associated protein
MTRSLKSASSTRSRSAASARRAAAPAARAIDSLAKTRLVVEAMSDVKAEDIKALDVRSVSSFADVFVIASGRSDRQVRAIADRIAEVLAEAGEPPLGIEGEREGRWVLIDCNDVIAHIFDPDAREHYDLERLWSDAPEIDVSAWRGEPDGGEA